MAIQPEDWQKETSRLANIREQIRRRVHELSNIVDERISDVIAVKRSFWDDISVNAEHEDDLIETAASITQQSHALLRQERSYRQAEDALSKLERIVDSPYFGRIDFKEEEIQQTEAIYIGLSSFIPPGSDEILIYDWRAPISSLFYDYPPGPASYITPEMTVSGDLSLKRQYIIKAGELQEMFDTGISIGDEMLQKMLSRSADEKMHSIVTTIQREQNQIIRDDKSKVLIVQGAAGSGKTSVALQRIAYLLYKYRKTLSADNMILFSPNSLFSDYVSNVLPELGEAVLQQTTFQEYLSMRLQGEALKVEDAYDQLEFLLAGTAETPDYQIRLEGIRYKASADFLHIIEVYAENLKSSGLRFRDFAVGQKVLLSEGQITQYFYGNPSNVRSLADRIEGLTEWIINKLNNIQADAEQRFYRKMAKEPKYLGTEPEMKRMSRRKADKAIAPLKEQARKLTYIDVTGLYRDLFDNPKFLAELANSTHQELPASWKSIAAYTSAKLEQGEILYEDATPLAYLKGLIQGQLTVSSIRYAIVDEAQDYSPFHYAFLKKLFPRARFTLLGDWNQGIYTHASQQGGYSSMSELLGEEETQTIHLVKSYRSTQEIVEFSKRILPHGEPVEPFSRSGETPRVTKANSVEDLNRMVANSVNSLNAEGAESIAIICKTKQETNRAFNELKESIAELQLIHKGTQHFEAGVQVVPAYLAKGLEFDAVVIYNAAQEIYSEEKERKLFYTACTRAMHHLHLFYTGEITPFLQ
jgi:DNA helicase-2/ATP-dependent DNA helicase PcrA